MLTETHTFRCGLYQSISSALFAEQAPQDGTVLHHGLHHIVLGNELLFLVFPAHGNRFGGTDNGADTSEDVVFLDGGKGHLNMAEKLWKELGVGIPILAVAKGPTRKISNSQFLISKQFPPPAGGSKLKFHKQFSEILNNRNLIKRITDEAHRFAIFYHRKVRGKQFRLGG